MANFDLVTLKRQTAQADVRSASHIYVRGVIVMPNLYSHDLENGERNGVTNRKIWDDMCMHY
jgi:hypothetical protein